MGAKVRKQNKQMQKAWVKRHLNGGVVPVHKFLYEGTRQYHEACFDALDWLESAQPAITSLEEAWNQCKRADWLGWAFQHLGHHSVDDVKALLKGAYAVLDFHNDNKDEVLGFYDKDTGQYYYGQLLHWKGFTLKSICRDESIARRNAVSNLVGILSDLVTEALNYSEERGDRSSRLTTLARTRKAAQLFRDQVPNPWVLK